MPRGSSIIVHKSPVIQLGLSSILQSLKVEVRELLSVCPDCSNIKDWHGHMIFIDTQYEKFIQKHRKYLLKGNNSIIGLKFTHDPIQDLSTFDEIIQPHEGQKLVYSKLSRFLKEEKSSPNQLSDRECEVLRLVALGNSNKQIAEKLFLSIHTVITHRKNITGKLGVKSISGLTLYASINNMID